MFDAITLSFIGFVLFMNKEWRITIVELYLYMKFININLFEESLCGDTQLLNNKSNLYQK